MVVMSAGATTADTGSDALYEEALADVDAGRFDRAVVHLKTALQQEPPHQDDPNPHTDPG